MSDYAVSADLVAQLDSSIVDELSNVTTDIDVALFDASRELDSRICSRYVTPVAATATKSREILRAKCVSIALFYFLGRKLSVGHSLTEGARILYIAAMDWAAGVAKKTYSLPDASILPIPDPDTVLATTHVTVGGALKIFGPESDLLRF